MAESPLRPPQRLPVYLAAVGLLLSAILEVLHLRTYLTPAENSYCSVSEGFDCALVAASPTSVFLGLPWALWGVVGFSALLLAALRRSLWLVPLSLASALVSLVLLGVSLLEIGSLCLFCEAVHLVTWALAFVAFRERRELTFDLRSPSSLYAIFAIPFSLALSAWLFLPSYWSAFNYRTAPPFATGTTEEGYPWIGASEPTLTLHEFTDYQCPHCRVASSRSLRWLDAHPGLRLVRRQHPRMRCTAGTHSCEAVRFAECAKREDKFWQADRWLFAHLGNGKSVELDRFAADLKLDRAALSSCIVAPSTIAHVDEEAALASKLRIVDTPTYLLDGKKLSPQAAAALVREQKP